jgi:restriction endonuclease S subunit
LGIRSIDEFEQDIIRQYKIGNFLATIDDKIRRTQAQTAQTQQYKKGLLQNMFV